jgi:predicted nucleic acid-binding protein
LKYILDTTVLIDHVRGYEPGAAILGRLFEETGDLFTCDVVSCEALSRGDPDEQRIVRILLDALEYVATGPEAARWAGERRRLGVEAGARKPAVADALIAGVAWQLGATVVTRNARDFEPFGVPVLGYG